MRWKGDIGDHHRHSALPLKILHDNGTRPLPSMDPRRDLVGSHVAKHLHTHGRPGDVLHRPSDLIVSLFGRPCPERPQQNAADAKNS